MKKLMTMSFIILFSVLSVLSCINFSYDALEVIEKDKQRITIEKPDDVTNDRFLNEIDSAMEEIGQDIMYRYVDMSGTRPHYLYYKTDHTDDLIQRNSVGTDLKIGEDECISTTDPAGYKVNDLHVAAVFQDITFYDWRYAARYDLSSCSYHVKKESCNAIAKKIDQLGYKVSIDEQIFISGKMPVLLFSFIPIFLMIMSMVFYALSNGKKNVIKKLEGYILKDILLDEMKSSGKDLSAAFFLIEVMTGAASSCLFKGAWIPYLAYSVPYILLGILVCIIGGVIGSLVIFLQDRAEHIKGKVPKKGIYRLAMFSKCVFVAFIAFFMSIAIRNVQVCYSTFLTSRFLAEKVEGYVSIPIYENNASSSGAEDGYLSFYLSTVDRYQGILVDASNYEYNITTGSTLCRSYGQDHIFVNDNYLTFNPIYDMNGVQIMPDKSDDQSLDILLPVTKQHEMEKYRAFARDSYALEADFILYDDADTEIYSYNARTGTGDHGKIASPVVIVLPEALITGVFVRSYCSKGSYFLKTYTADPYSELLPELEKAGIERVTPQTPYISSNFDEILDQQFQMLILYGSQTLILSIGSLCLIVFTAKLYCENYREHLSCRLFEGFTLGMCIRRHIMLTVVSYLVSMLAVCMVGRSVNVKVDAFIPIGALLFDTLCTFMVCRKYVRADLQEILKGAA